MNIMAQLTTIFCGANGCDVGETVLGVAALFAVCVISVVLLLLT